MSQGQQTHNEIYLNMKMLFSDVNAVISQGLWYNIKDRSSLEIYFILFFNHPPELAYSFILSTNCGVEKQTNKKKTTNYKVKSMRN